MNVLLHNAPEVCVVSANSDGVLLTHDLALSELFAHTTGSECLALAKVHGHTTA